jgi:hypothetical protein
MEENIACPVRELDKAVPPLIGLVSFTALNCRSEWSSSCGSPGCSGASEASRGSLVSFSSRVCRRLRMNFLMVLRMGVSQTSKSSRSRWARPIHRPDQRLCGDAVTKATRGSLAGFAASSTMPSSAQAQKTEPFRSMYWPIQHTLIRPRAAVSQSSMEAAALTFIWSRISACQAIPFSGATGSRVI